MVTIKFHVQIETQGAASVRCQRGIVQNTKLYLFLSLPKNGLDIVAIRVE